MFYRDTSKPRLWKALLATALFVFPSAYLLHHFAWSVPAPFWYGIAVVLWLLFAYKMNERMIQDYGIETMEAMREDEIGN